MDNSISSKNNKQVQSYQQSEVMKELKQIPFSSKVQKLGSKVKKGSKLKQLESKKRNYGQFANGQNIDIEKESLLKANQENLNSKIKDFNGDKFNQSKAKNNHKRLKYAPAQQIIVQNPFVLKENDMNANNQSGQAKDATNAKFLSARKISCISISEVTNQQEISNIQVMTTPTKQRGEEEEASLFNNLSTIQKKVDSEFFGPIFQDFKLNLSSVFQNDVQEEKLDFQPNLSIEVNVDKVDLEEINDLPAFQDEISIIEHKELEQNETSEQQQRELVEFIEIEKFANQQQAEAEMSESQSQTQSVFNKGFILEDDESLGLSSNVSQRAKDSKQLSNSLGRMSISKMIVIQEECRTSPQGIAERSKKGERVSLKSEVVPRNHAKDNFKDQI